MTFLPSLRRDLPRCLRFGSILYAYQPPTKDRLWWGLKELRRRKSRRTPPHLELSRGKTGLQTPTARGWGGGHESTPSTLHPRQHFSCEGDWQGLSQGPRERPGMVSGNPPPPWRPRRQAEGGQGVNSRENSDKWAPPPRPLPPIKAKPSQRRCRNHFQARHDINISAISGGQWGVRLIEKHRWIRPAPDTQADGKYHCLSAVS